MWLDEPHCPRSTRIMCNGEHLSRHGPRLSRDEYERRIVDLYGQAPAAPDRNQQADLSRRELDLMIDYRLGLNFPSDRRDALQRLRRKTETSLGRSALFLMCRVLLRMRMKRLSRILLRDYRKVLSEPEFRAFFDLRDDE